MKRRFWLVLLALLLGCATPQSEQTAIAPPALVPESVEITFEPAATLTEVSAPTPAPTSTPTPAPTSTPTPTPSSTPAPTPYAILWLPDTQQLSYSYPDRLSELGTWIAERIESENIVCAVHTGDIVDNGFKDWEWENFDLALQQFYGRVPFVPVAGNHDIGVKLGSYAAYVKRDFLSAFPEEQKFEGGKMLYTVLDAGGEQLLLLSVGWNMGKTKAEQTWLDVVMEQYADLPCILLTHGYLTNQKRILPSCRYLETNIVQRYSNVKLVLSGHSRDYYSMDASYDDDGDGVPDRTVHALMLNRQGKAYCLRILRFDPLTHDLSVQTYAPHPDTVVTEIDDLGPINFTIPNAY